MLELSMRRTSARPAGGGIAAVSGRKATAATITSQAAVPAGLLIVRVVPEEPAEVAATKAATFAGRRAGVCVLAGAGLAPAVAVFAPVPPAAAWTAYVPSVEWPRVLG